ncbi:MAG TPA: rhodanese-like domain-containing protein [Spirochaetia bacterium]|nr:rhodanese-like domain-containing protein [Spirochaetia bacterium]
MTANVILEKIRTGAAIIDVRTEDEFMDGHYPNAVNIPVNEIMDRAEEIGPKDKPVVVYCESGSRSAYAAMMLKVEGFTDVTNAGGLVDMPEL